MTLPSITLADGAGAAPGRYVDAELAQKLAENLERLTWQVLYGKAYDKVGITYSGCLGPCDQGPNVLVFPEGVLYSGVTPADVVEIFDQHLERGETVERLTAPAAVW